MKTKKGQNFSTSFLLCFRLIQKDLFPFFSTHQIAFVLHTSHVIHTVLMLRLQFPHVGVYI